MTSGERRLSERLEQKLEDDYLCWYDVPLGPQQRQPDFVVFHPARGFVVLEVKDWKLDSIRSIDRASVELLTELGIKRVSNPMSQARVYALEVVVALERDPALRNPANTPHAGRLIMPYGFGVVLSSITRKQFEATDLGQVLEPHKVICQDEMTDSVDAEDFQSRIWGMFSHVFACKLSLPQIERVRWHLFPELRVSSGQGQFGLFDGPGHKTLEIPDLIKVMDIQQEMLARSLGDGHRVIHGVAGSGKTMILGYRCLYLARALRKPILVLCFNVTLAARLRELLAEQGAAEQVSVCSFHEWCRDMLRTYHVDIPRNSGGYAAYTAALVAQTIASVERGQIPRGQYGAVMIDEGHDFEPEWFQLVVQMVDPDSNAVLVLYDDAQSIYKQQKQRKFSFASVGIQAQGRTTILKLNYRNTLEILSVAKAFADELLNPQESDDDGAPIVAPESAGRRGPLPELVQCKDDWAEARFIVERIRDEVAQGRALSDIAVLVQHMSGHRPLITRLEECGIPYLCADSQSRKRAVFEGAPSVKIVTVYSSKGLEFGATFIPRLDAYGVTDDKIDADARLLYVGMTRATQRLVMLHQAEGGMVGRVRESIKGVSDALAA
ncbi:MAG: NERD domain-containing protein [Gammaproteobacteria bacterium]|nr:NERD domain-containing protein [Gammaproteobacteria bacterium]